jgi:carbon storage regulator
MLVLSRRPLQKIIIGDNEIQITVLSVNGSVVRLGICAPDGMAVHREEIFDILKMKNELCSFVKEAV